MARKIPLLEKFEINIEKLDYSYIETCENGSELEKIYKILVSNEEGYYPDLTEAARKRLEIVRPNARCLRTEEKLLKRDYVEYDTQEKIKSDLQEFLQMTKKQQSESDHRIQQELPIIPIRNEIPLEKVPINQNAGEERSSAMKIEEINVEEFSENQLRELESIYRNKGNNHFKAQEFNEALLLYSKCLETFPNPHAYNNRAITCKRRSP